jgi:hypothetical protein
MRTLLLAVMIGGSAVTSSLGSLSANSSAATLATTPQPYVHVEPDSVPANTATRVRGGHFGRDETVELWECSQTKWVGIPSPCTGGKVLRTEMNGRLVTRLEIYACAGTSSYPQACYVGIFRAGYDERGSLRPYADITVTAPSTSATQ